MTLRVGIVSANWGAVAHLPAWRAIAGVEVVGICTSRRETAEAAAARLGIDRAFWSVDEMAADAGIDIIDCGTRPSYRETMVASCLQGGKHVYNGIPFAAGLEGARRLHEAWAASGLVGVVDAFSEWLPAPRLARQMLDEGYLGQPFGGTCIFNLPLFSQLNPHFPYNWFAQSGHGVSAVRNLGSHALHLLTFLLGDVDELVAHDGRLLDEWRSADGQTRIEVGTNDFANVLLRFTSGLTLQFQVSWSATLGRGFLLDLFGSEGRIVLEAPSFPTSRGTKLSAGRLGDAGVTPVELPETLFRADGIGIDADVAVPPAYPMALAMSAMVDAVRGENRARPDFDQAWRIERVLEAIRVSADERRWITLAEID
jgi:predicted dehydrogenase